MDYSQYIRLKQEAANSYVARTKTVDSSFLTLRNQQRAAYAGDSTLNTPAYYKGSPIVNPIYPDISANPINHKYTQGYASIRPLNQQSLATRNAGAAVCGDADYSVLSPGIQIKSLAEMNTILTSYDNNALKPSIPANFVYVPRYTFPTSLASMYFNGNSFLELEEDTAYYGSNNYTIYITAGGQFTATWINGSNTLTYTGGTLPTNGQSIWGVAIQSATTVTNISGNTITISKTTIAPDHGISGSTDFTMEFYIQPKESGGNTQTVFFIGQPAIANTYKFIGNLIATVAGKAYTFNVKVSTLTQFRFGEFLAGKWYHVAIMRYGQYMYFFQNGVNMGNIYVGTYIPDANNPNPVPSNPLGGNITYLSGISSLAILGGAYDYLQTGGPFTNGFTGYLTNFRWTKGTAVYLDYRDFSVKVYSTFDVPQVPLSVSTNALNTYVAVGLLASNSSNILTNTCTPVSSPLTTISVTDGYSISNSYDLVTWGIV